jgi:hypothetical protein
MALYQAKAKGKNQVLLHGTAAETQPSRTG